LCISRILGEEGEGDEMRRDGTRGIEDMNRLQESWPCCMDCFYAWGGHLSMQFSKK
jgi:hypothetical protein